MAKNHCVKCGRELVRVSWTYCYSCGIEVRKQKLNHWKQINTELKWKAKK